MDISNKDMKIAAQMVQSMKGKSEDDMIRELSKMIKSGQGGITPEKAEQMISMFFPMVNQDQRIKLEKLLREIKK